MPQKPHMLKHTPFFPIHLFHKQIKYSTEKPSTLPYVPPPKKKKSGIAEHKIIPKLLAVRISIMQTVKLKELS